MDTSDRDRLHRPASDVGWGEGPGFGDLTGSTPAASGGGTATTLSPGDGRPLPDGTVTFLLTDIEGSTRRWESDPKPMAGAVARHYEIIDELVAAHGGARPQEQGEGDSVVAVFPRGTDAVTCGVAIQLGFAAEPWPATLELRPRVAIHSGEALLRGELNYSGSSIIRAARVRALAHGGQILVSGSTHDLVVDGLPAHIELTDLGTFRLENLGRPERLFQVQCEGLAHEFPRLRNAAVAHDVPSELTSFVGREAAVSDVCRLVADERLVTLTGSGGCGKTRLAARVASQCADRFGFGAWWVELGSLEDPALVAPALRAAFGLLPDPSRSDIDRVVEYLGSCSALVVLDNCEHLSGAVAEVTRALVERSASVHVLMTSRARIGLDGEIAWRVPSLSCPAPSASLADVRASEAGRLFVERAQQTRSDAVLKDHDAAAIALVCERLDGIPLAIELAAARTRVMSPAEIVRGLDDRFALLTTGGRAVAPRHQTLLASIDWSYRLLGEREQTLVTRLAVFAGGCTLDALGAVVCDEKLPQQALLDTVTDLVDKSLLVALQRADATRFVFLDSVREYALHRLTEHGEGDVIRARHATWIRKFVEDAQTGLEGADKQAWLARVDDEIDNARAAMSWADETHDAETFATIVGSLTPFWIARGRLQEGKAGFDRVFDQQDELAPATLAWAKSAAAQLAWFLGDPVASYALAEGALVTARLIKDAGIQSRALSTLGSIELFVAPAPGHARFEEAIALAEAVSDDWSLSTALLADATAYCMQEDHDAAATLLDRAEQLSARSGPDHAVLLLALRSWGYIRWGRFDDARDLLEPLIATTIELGDLTVLGVVLNFYGQAVQALGEAEAADSLLRSALAEATDRSAVYPMILITVALALNDLESGRPKACRTMIAANRGAASQAGLVMGFMYDLVDAYAAVLEADWSAVRRSAVTAIEYADQLGSVWGKTFAATTDAVARRHLDDASGAEETAHAALRTADDKGFVPLIAECLELIAGIATDRESYEESARLFGAATAIRASVNMRTPRRSARELSNDYASLRNALGDDAFEHLRDQGALMDTAEAIAYASRARGERKRPSAGWESLTPRERDVVRLAAAGLTNPQIAEKLFIGRATVKAHLASVFGKLGVRTRAELASEATRRGNEQPAR